MVGWWASRISQLQFANGNGAAAFNQCGAIDARSSLPAPGSSGLPRLTGTGSPTCTTRPQHCTALIGSAM